MGTYAGTASRLPSRVAVSGSPAVNSTGCVTVVAPSAGSSDLPAGDVEG
jgi:hypothetical protein